MRRLGAVAAVETALAVPARAASPATIDETIFSFFLSDIVRLPFDSNSTKVGVSRHIGTNGPVNRSGNSDQLKR